MPSVSLHRIRSSSAHVLVVRALVEQYCRLVLSGTIPGYDVLLRSGRVVVVVAPVRCLRTVLLVHQSVEMHRIVAESSVERHMSLLLSCHVVFVLLNPWHVSVVVLLRVVGVDLRSLVLDVLMGFTVLSKSW